MKKEVQRLLEKADHALEVAESLYALRLRIGHALCTLRYATLGG